MQLNFSAQEVQPASADFEPVPAGWYTATVEKAEFLPLKAGNGSRISLQARIQGPTHQNRVIFGSINYQHTTSPQAQEIGQRQLSALCHAINVMALNNVQQLCNIPFEVRLKVVPPTYNVKGDVNSGVLYEAKNEMQGFRAVGAGSKDAAGSSAAPAAKAAPQSAPQSRPQSAPVQTTTVAAETAAVDPAVLAMAQQLIAQQQQTPAEQAEQAQATTTTTTEQPKQPW